jgi:hypothetical protein
MARKEHKFHYIYRITNTKNGNYYTGMHSTNNLEDGYMGGGTRIRNSIRKHGKEFYTKEILEFLDDRESLARREKEIVNESLLQDKFCMNLKKGGEGGGKIWSKEHLKKFTSAGGFATNEKIKKDPSSWIQACKDNSEKISKKLKEMYESGEMKPHFLGKSHKEETILLMKEKKKGHGIGELNSQFGIRWINNGSEIKKIKKTEELPAGWSYGKKIKSGSN